MLSFYNTSDKNAMNICLRFIYFNCLMLLERFTSNPNHL